MIAFPNAKINLGLKVLSKRPDGFHDIETIFLPIAFRDVLEIMPARATETSIKTFGLDIPGSSSDNLCLKAWALLKKDLNIPPVNIFLYKNIPPGAGLGGGSADAAFTLKLLNVFFKLNLNGDELEGYARKLGSDCAFFIRNKPVLARAKGDIFSPVDIVLKKFIILVIPPLHVSTLWAYQNVNPYPSTLDWKRLAASLFSTWKNIFENDFEKPVMDTFPQIASIRDKLYESGAVYASMSGSGAAVYALFDEKPSVMPDFPGCRIWNDTIEI